ncbi:MAG: glycosyltransferase [Phycisphaeraceae bacterium]|nr:glycosyltransferase [Phycisphaerae bacterium]MBX3391042.1 glycosyltransferase [Phycisphaeraceae bacterium]
MRIVLVNWAKIWDGAVSGGGVNGYCQSLALELVSHGHEVVYLCGGVTYVPPGGSLETAGPCEVRRHPDWLGVRVFEVVNSPVVAPSIHQFTEPAGEIADEVLDRVIGEFFSIIMPDVVHFHNVEGFTAQCVLRARVPRATGGLSAVFYSLHNYHTVCPQVYLMQGHRRPCLDSRSCLACEGCIQTTSPAEEIRRRMAEFASKAGPGAGATDSPGPEHASATLNDHATGPRSTLLRQIGSELRSLVTSSIREMRAPPAHPATGDAGWAIGPPGEPVGPGTAIHLPLMTAGPDLRGQTPHLVAEQSPPRRLGPGDPEWRPLENDPTADPLEPESPNDYARRRRAMIDMLNSCDRVLAVSEFVRRKFEAMGVDAGRIRTDHIGTRLNRVVRAHKDVAFEPPPFDRDRPRPVRLVFMGFNNWYKGLPMLADSLEMLTPDQLSRLHLFIYGLGVGADEWRFRRMEPRLGGLTIHPMYAYYDVPWILGGKDLGIVPSVWWDNAPQTVFEFFACGVPVLGANLGGIPDFVRDGVNGLLFRGNDRYDLARRLGEVVAEPWKLHELRRGVTPPREIGEHAEAMERMYSEVIESGWSGSRAGAAGPVGGGAR